MYGYVSRKARPALTEDSTIKILYPQILEEERVWKAIANKYSVDLVCVQLVTIIFAEVPFKSSKEDVMFSLIKAA